jgi:uncharacterized membrane protein
MSKKGSRRYQGNYNYNRQSQGYQKNLYRQKLNQENIKAPKAMDEKKLRYIMIGGGVAILVLIIVLTVFFKWKGLLIGLLIGFAAVGCTYLYLRNKQKEMITYYKKIGMTEELYVQELRRRNTDAKQIEAFRRMWRKTKVDSTIADSK